MDDSGAHTRIARLLHGSTDAGGGGVLITRGHGYDACTWLAFGQRSSASP